MTPSTFGFENATVGRADGGTVLRDLTWAVRPGEAWAVVGRTASGKTTLLEAVAGKHRVTAGTRVPLAGVVRTVAFKENSRTFRYSDKYYQQRFEFADADEPLSLAQFLTAGTPAAPDAVARVAGQLGIAAQLSQPFLTLSNGQTRRARVARALLFDPDWLLLDDPFTGIDADGRTELAARLGELVTTGCGVIMATAPEQVPAWVSHVVELRDGRVRFAGARVGWESWEGEAPAATHNDGAEGASPSQARQGPHPRDAEPVIELTGVTVRHRGKAILDGVNWTVRQGERWAVLGANGAGKTTLLALACGDHPQAFSNDVKLFGRRRGSGETVWDVKRQVGFASPEFHLYFREPLTAFEAAATAFGDALLYRTPTAEQAARVRAVFAAFGCTELEGRPFRQLSVGQQRLVLVARAVAKDAPLLILDEPFQGLDAAAAGRVRDWLDDTLRPDQTLVFVTHVPSHLPRIVNRWLHLAAGRVIG